MVVGTLSLVQKGQTRECSGCSTQWNSGLWWWVHCLWCKKVYYYFYIPLFCCVLCPLCTASLVWPFCTKDNVPTIIYHYSTAYGVHWFDLFVSKTMSPPPYTTILLHPLCTASSGLTFLYQRQCPSHDIPLFHCIHCVLHPLHPLVWPFLQQRQCPHHHIPLFHCILCLHHHISLLHCILRPLCPLVWSFCTKDNVPTIYHYSTASTPSSHLCVILTQPDISRISSNTMTICVKDIRTYCQNDGVRYGYRSQVPRHGHVSVLWLNHHLK